MGSTDVAPACPAVSHAAAAINSPFLTSTAFIAVSFIVFSPDPNVVAERWAVEALKS
jgi:hypothetical protein